MLSDGVGDLSWGEVDCWKIVACPYFYLFRTSLHNGNSGLDGIVHIDHWKSCLLGKVALIFSLSQCSIKYLNGIISCPHPWQFFPAYYPRVSNTSNVQSIPVKVVLSQKLPSVFSDAIHSSWLYWSMLRCFLLGSSKPKDCYWTCPEYSLNFELNTKIEKIFQGY